MTFFRAFQFNKFAVRFQFRFNYRLGKVELHLNKQQIRITHHKRNAFREHKNTHTHWENAFNTKKNKLYTEYLVSWLVFICILYFE